jgi:uncharacterized protein (TIGR03083 family)
MPSSLTFADYGTGIGDAVSVIRANAVSAGLGAPVPPCPGWSVLDLVLHVGLAHRWATANLEGVPREGWPTEEQIRDEGRAAPDVLDWFDEGMARLLHVLASAPEDLQAFFFLKDAARPREAWARRQCHETTVHGEDAMAARLGRVPDAGQTWIRPALAADGVDELLMGFVPRRTSRLRTAPGEDPYAVLVRAGDVDRAWTLRVSADPVVTTTGTRAEQQAILEQAGLPAVVVEDGAVALYLGLWNRGPLSTEGSDRAELAAAFVTAWRRDQRVEWS